MTLMRKVYLFVLLLCMAGTHAGYAQCDTAIGPTFSKSTFNEYFFYILPLGDMGTTSTIVPLVVGNYNSYVNLSATQGIDAPVGSAVTLYIERYTTHYTGYLSVYIDWDRNGTFDADEYAGWPSAPKDIEMFPTDMVTAYDITLPCSMSPGRYHMRIMLSESHNNDGAPCSGTYGQAYDYYYNFYCPSHALVGDTALCVGGDTSTLHASYGCGTWSSSNPSVAAVGSTGIVTSTIMPGTAVITYSSAVCGISVDTVSVGPGPVTGGPEVCVGRSTMLTSATSGGTWSSSNSSVASVSGSGTTCTVSGVAVGSATIWYTADGCTFSFPMNVRTEISITGDTMICQGGNRLLTVVSPGGTWTSSNSTIATVNSGGVVSGVYPGTAIITYETPGGGCLGYHYVYVVHPVITVAAYYAGHTGNLCLGTSVGLEGNYGGAGTWTSSNSLVAPVTSSGFVSGIATGGATIAYSVGSCTAIWGITVIPSPVISGSSVVCDGSPANLSASISGGTWSSQNSSIASVSSSGVVTGHTAGTATFITYTAPNGCFGVKVITVGSIDITGGSYVCLGSTLNLSGSPTGGTWSSSNNTVASIGSSDGIVSGLTLGTTNITYVGGTCRRVISIEVRPYATISGATNACVGGTVSLVPSIIGGTWTSSPSSLAYLWSGAGGSENVTCAAAGTANILYSLNGCVTNHPIVIYDNPSISGAGSVCVGSSTPLVASIPGGTWSSSNTGVATVSGGVVSGIATGFADITYIVNGCSGSFTISVNQTPTLYGASHVCGAAGITHNASYNLTADPTGGSWASSNTSVATVSGSGGTGVVSCVDYASGDIAITYTAGGCSITHNMRIATQPYNSGSVHILRGSCPWSDNLSVTPTGGSWVNLTVVETAVAWTGDSGGESHAAVTQGTGIISNPCYHSHTCAGYPCGIIYYNLADGSLVCFERYEYHLAY